MKASDMTMCRNKRFTMKVLLGLAVVACLLPLQVEAQVNSINSFVNCVNALGPNATAADAVACVPSSGCFFTNTLSEESGQPACTLRDGTRLPRVLFSCTGPNGSQTMRFRPSFSLCTQGGIINHIELGEDVRKNNTDDPGFAGYNIQYMADVDMTVHVRPFKLFLPATDTRLAVVDAASPANSKGCAECHDRKGTVTTNVGTFNSFGPIPPALGDGTISTNDPFVIAPSPSSTVPLSTICTGINNSSQLQKNATTWDLAKKLCNALQNKQ